MANVFAAIRDEITGPEMDSATSNYIPSPSNQDGCMVHSMMI